MNELNSIEKKALDLLIEFRELCYENNLKFFLGPRMTALADCFGGFGRVFRIPDICMPLEDALSFISIIEKKDLKDRAIYYMGNNSCYSSFSACYVNENTTFIEINQGDNYSKHGVRIKIEFLRPEINGKIASVLETGWESNGFRMLKKRDFKMNAGRRVIKVFQWLYGEKAAGKMFDYFVKQYSGKKKHNINADVFLKRMKHKRVVFRKELFENAALAEFEGEMFPVPDNRIEYVESVLGYHWRNKIHNEEQKSRNIFAYNVPYRVVIDEFEKKGKSLSEDIFDKKKESLNYSIKNRDIFDSKKNAWALARCSGDRLRQYEILRAQWDTICRLREEKKYDELYEIFREYDQKTKMYLKKNIGMCASKEILDIECELLEYNGEKKIAEELIRLAPKEHYAPLGKG